VSPYIGLIVRFIIALCRRTTMGVSDGVRRRCSVATEPNGDGATTLCGFDGRTYQVIDASEAVRDRLAELRRGDAVEVVLEPVRCRGDGWRLVRLEGGGPRGASVERTASSPERRPAERSRP